MAEYAPAALKWLADEIIKAIPSAEFSGIVGDADHVYGYHRCRNKLPSSDYSVQTKPDREGDGDAASALDMKFNAEWMKKITRRLLDSAKDQNDPRLNYMREFFGTLDGQKVTGWDTYYGKPVSSDDSHLWHIHMSILRKYCTSKEKMANILSVIKGEDDMDLSDRVKVADWINDRWDDVGDSISVRTALGSSYGHARSAKDALYDTVIPMLEQLTAGGAQTASADLKPKLISSLTETLGAKFDDLDADELDAAVEAAVTKALASLED